MSRTSNRWSKDFLEAGKKRLAGDTARAATSDEVKDLRREASALKEVVADDRDGLRQEFKALLRAGAARTIPDLWSAIATAIDRFTPAECRAYFAAAGYDAT